MTSAVICCHFITRFHFKKVTGHQISSISIHLHDPISKDQLRFYAKGQTLDSCFKSWDEVVLLCSVSLSLALHFKCVAIVHQWFSDYIMRGLFLPPLLLQYLGLCWWWDKEKDGGGAVPGKLRGRTLSPAGRMDEEISWRRKADSLESYHSHLNILYNTTHSLTEAQMKARQCCCMSLKNNNLIWHRIEIWWWLNTLRNNQSW